MLKPQSALHALHPVLVGWFARSFGEPTPVQVDAWASILSGCHTLIAAPTGSGKTLAALLPCLDRLVRDKSAAGSSWQAGVRVLYITPLKALNNDIHHHLAGFIDAIEQYREQEQDSIGDIVWPGIRSAVRTGDTPSSERTRMARKPPDVLITTPESLYLLLTSDKGRAMLKTVRSVIIDEIHSLAPDKRGAHLSLSLERLSALCEAPLQRIGVSATQKPIRRIARFLGGWEPADSGAASEAASADTAAEAPRAASLEAAPRGPGDAEGKSEAEDAQAPLYHPLGYRPRPVHIIESAMSKQMDVRVTMPDLSRPAKTRDAVWTPILERLMQLMEGCRSVLLFVNSRRMCERLVLRLNEHTGYEMARAHHGSLARERRLEVERMLKDGELRCLVATSSLELGIDVGHVDAVIQIDSPKAAAAGIQRIGRAGHAVGDISRGYIVARTRSELPEAAVLCRDIIRRDIEPITLPDAPLDVLSQQATAIVAAADISPAALYALAAGSECYRSLPMERLEAALQVLAGFYPFARPLMEWDRSANLLRKRPASSIASVTGAGTIPSSSAYPVHHADSRTHLGELDEEYIQESRVGDVFQLGTSSWMISAIENDRVYVKEAPNRFSEIPFWRAEPGGRSSEMGERLGRFISELSARLGLDHAGSLPAAGSPVSGSPAASGASTLTDLDADALDWLGTHYGLDAQAAAELIGLIRSQHKALALPTDRRIVIEHYRDLMNQTRVIIHNPFGRRLNRTWLLAIERQFEKLLPYKLYGNAKDNGIELVLPDWDASWLQSLWHVTPESVEPLLTEAAAGSPLLAVAFRRIAETSLLLARSFTRTPMWQKRLRSEELLKQAIPYAGQFPYLQEAMRECLHIYMDMEGLQKLLARIAAGKIEVIVRETNAPSPFAVQFLADYVNTQIYEGDGLSEATQLQLLSASKSLAKELFGAEAVKQAVDPAIAAEEAQRLASGSRTPASPGELLQLLKRRGDMSLDEIAAICGKEAAPDWINTLEREGRAAAFDFGGERRWICSEEQELYALFPAAEHAVAFVAGRFADSRLSFTDEELRSRYPTLSARDAIQVVDVLLAIDRIEHAPFAADEYERIWTSRSVAKRLIRLTAEQARRQAEPIDPVRWCSYMSMLQHALSGTQLSGTDGLLAVIAKLQGFYLPASHWESIIFPARLTDYRKEDLDLLCASGEVVWLGRKDAGEKEGKIAFFLAESKALYAPFIRHIGAPSKEAAAMTGARPQGEPGLSPGAAALLALLRDGGASFLTRLSRETGKVPSELLTELTELVWAGLVSNDQFAPMRVQLETKGKQLARTGSGQGRWYWTGSLADHADSPAESPPASPYIQPAANGQQVGAGAQRADDMSESAMSWTQHLLDSCGIVTKELVAASAPFSWEELMPIIRQLETWGVITRGLIIAGNPSLQFAKRQLLSDVKQPLPGQDSSAISIIAAVDPANPFGLAVPWPSGQGASFARKSGNFIVLHQGRWRFWLENNGRKIIELPAHPPEYPPEHANARVPVPHSAGSAEAEAASLAPLLKQILRTVLRRQKLSKLRIDEWNGVPVQQADAGAVIRALGAEKDRQSLILWPSQLQ